ncbi:unknown [Bacteroides sp. CAG:545]|nr:unknown [Bacteroides sp. CAG:545]
MPAHIIRGVRTLVNDMPADFMAISSLFSAICPTVITEARSVASGRESGSIVALPHPRNSSIILSPKPLPTSSSIYSHRYWSMRMNTTTIRIPKNGPKNDLMMNWSSFFIPYSFVCVTADSKLSLFLQACRERPSALQHSCRPRLRVQAVRHRRRG